MAILDEFGEHECQVCGTDCVEVEQQLDDKDRLIAQLRARLASLEWTPISESNLPKVGDEMIARHQYKMKSWVVVSNVPTLDRGWQLSDYKNNGWSHFRPINPPAAPSAGGPEK